MAWLLTCMVIAYLTVFTCPVIATDGTTAVAVEDLVQEFIDDDHLAGSGNALYKYNYQEDNTLKTDAKHRDVNENLYFPRLNTQEKQKVSDPARKEARKGETRRKKIIADVHQRCWGAPY